MPTVTVPPHAPPDCGECCSQWIEKFVSQEPAPDDSIANVDHELAEARDRVSYLERVRTEKVWLQEVRKVAARAWMEATRLFAERREAEREARRPIEAAEAIVMSAGLEYLAAAEAQATGAQVDPLYVHSTQSALLEALRTYRQAKR